MPEVEFPVVTITAIYPGADPETIESKIIDKIEEAVNQIQAIKVLSSRSMESVGMVIIQFELERDANQAVQDVRDKMSLVLKDLPSDLDPPIVQKFDLGAMPVLSLALSGNLSPKELTRIAEDIVKQRLETVAGVGGIDLIGNQKREFKVWLDPMRAEAYGLTSSDIVQTLKAQNVEIPGGRIDMGEKEFVVKTKGQVNDANALANIIITAYNGATIKIGDVAKVEDGEVESRSHSDVSSVSAVSLVIRKQSGANTVNVADKLKAEIEKLKKEMPSGVKLSIPVDNSTFIKNAISGVKEDLIIGAFFAVLIVYLFLRDWRATLISALALPTSVIATFAFIKSANFTFNVISMLALSLSIGMLIDDAIVVIENIHRHLEMGKRPMKAASDAVREIGLAVMATTATIVAVFVPVGMMKGMIGRFFVQFGLTVAFAVVISLFVAFTLTPMLSSRFLKIQDERKDNVLFRAFGAFLNRLDETYKGILAWALDHKAATIAIAIGIFVFSLFLGKFVKSEFMPTEDRGMLKVSVEMPTGTSLEKTKEYVAKIGEEIRKVPGVDYTFTTIGGGTEQEVNKGVIQVNFTPKNTRAFNQNDGMIYMRKLFSNRPEALFSVDPVGGMGDSGFMRSAIIQYNLQGRDFGQLNSAADKIIAMMKEKGGYVDIDTTYRGGKPEFSVIIDRDRAADLGVPIAMLALTIRTFFAGEKAGELVTNGTRYDVRVQLPGEMRKTPEDILKLKARSTTGALVPLSNLIKIKQGEGPSKIERRSRMRNVTVLANLQGKALGDAVKEIDEKAATLTENVKGSWTGMADIMKDSFEQLGLALFLAIVMVYLILAAQFESFLHPLTIMMSLPFSIIGAMGGLLIFNYTMNMMSMIGIIMLMGLVTKNAILLVDYTNTLRERGMGVRDALLAAGPVRLRPILMTTAAMIFGMIPVALALSEGGEQRAPMAVAVIGGLTTSTFLTLIIVPVMYFIVENLKAKVIKTQHDPADTLD